MSTQTFSPISKLRHQHKLSYEELALWTEVDIGALTGEPRARFSRLSRSMNLLCEGASLKQAAEAAALSARRLQKLIENAREVASDGRLKGFRAFVVGSCKKKYERAAPVQGRSFSGAFAQLLKKHPKVEQALIAYLRDRRKKNIVVNTRSWARVHQEFLAICVAEGVAQDGYPFTAQQQGKAALSRWVHRDFSQQFQQDYLWEHHGPEAAKNAKTLTPAREPASPAPPYTRWQIDAYTIDVEALYEYFDSDLRWTQVPMSRFIVLVAIDTSTGAFLAVLIVLKRQADAGDVLTLLWNAMSGEGAPRMKLDIIGDVPGAGYPAQVLEKLRFVAPLFLELDNALAHLCTSLKAQVEGRWGCVISYGKGRTPQTRGSVESHIAQLACDLIQHLPGTTGAHPKDATKLRAKEHVGKLLPVNLVIATVDAFLRNRNAEGATASSGLSPLQKLAHLLRRGVISAKPLPLEYQKPHMFVLPKAVRIKAQPEVGRMPYVNFYQVRYTCDALRRRLDLAGKRYWLRYDPRDLRRVYLYDMHTGAFAYELRAEGLWGSIPTSLAFRRLAIKAMREQSNQGRHIDSMLTALPNLLREKALEDKTAALQLAEFMNTLARFSNDLNGDLAGKVDQYFTDQQAATKAATIPINPFETRAKQGDAPVNAAASKFDATEDEIHVINEHKNAIPPMSRRRVRTT